MHHMNQYMCLHMFDYFDMEWKLLLKILDHNYMNMLEYNLNMMHHNNLQFDQQYNHHKSTFENTKIKIIKFINIYLPSYMY